MNNKYALITGASRGIGKAIAIKLAAELNYNILLNYASNDEAAKETKSLIEAENVSCTLLKFDVANAAQTTEILGEWMELNKEAKIEVLVNNAGITRDGLFMWMKPEDWNSVINTSLNGFYNVTQPLLEKYAYFQIWKNY